MSPTGRENVRVRADASGGERERRLVRIDRLSDLLDSRWRVPVLGWRVGLDSIIGLIPGLGDAFGLGMGAYLMYEARKLGAGPILLGRMAVNILADSLLGTVPLLGDAFDIFFRAHRRNAKLLKKHMGKSVRADRD